MPDRGALVVSLDLELMWGFHDIPHGDDELRQCRGTRAAVERLLTLFDRHQIPATWATVGHLFLDESQRGPDGRPHPSHPRPRHHWVQGDWFRRLPHGDRQSCPEWEVWYAPDLIARIQDCKTPQEIGSHSFSHVIFSDPGCDQTVALAELERCQELAARMGLSPLKSFVFPRNDVAHLPLLKQAGFEVFRSREPTFYWQLPETLRKPFHILDRLLATTPVAVRPRRTASGVIDLPGSMLYLPAMGWRRHIPIQRRVAQAHKGLHEASRQKAVFHFWLHPEGLVDGAEGLFAGLEEILVEAVRQRRRGQLDFLTMHQAGLAYLD